LKSGLLLFCFQFASVQASEMFEVAELFYARQREFGRMVECAIDSSKYDKKHVFEVIGSLMANGQLR
jgi:hypothetical protein